MAHGKMAGAERVLLELLAETPRGTVLVCVPEDSPLGARVVALGHSVQDFSLPKLREERSVFHFAGSYLAALRTLRRTLVAEDVSVVHAFVAVTSKVVAPAAWLTRTPAILSVHEITTPDSIGFLRSRLQRIFAISSFRRITAVSQFVADSLVSDGYPSNRIAVLHNGIARRAPRVNTSEQRAMLGLPADALIFVVAGRLTRWKGQQIALDAFIRFRKSHPNVDAHLLIVGGPFEEVDRVFERELTAKVGSEHLHDSVHLYGHQDEVEPFYDAADVVLVPSLEPDPFPTVVLEAGLAGRPVIATDQGGAREAVVHGQTGLVVSPTIEAFSKAMDTAMDPVWRLTVGEAALLHVEREFSRSQFAGRVFAEWEAAKQ
jgi:glycosyltransferase involved in cell wall biosynthesis